MKHLVVLDAASVIGAAYLAGLNDGLAHGNPCLNCESIDTSHPHYMQVVRAFRYQGESRRQTLQVPHHAVAFVLAYDAGDPDAARFGFQPPNS